MDRLRGNVATIRKKASGLDLMGVVKADAYGHGALSVARELQSLGVKHLGVATVPEALALRAEGIEANIMVFAPLRRDWVDAATEACLDVVVDSQASLEAALLTKGRLRCHLKVDTGMGRLGQSPEKSESLL
ncbi:MAG: alanine racemase, partial [Rhodothermales bacterium]